MKKQRRLQIRPFRALAYLLLFTENAILFGALQSYFFFLTGFFMIVFLFLSIFGTFWLEKNLQVQMHAETERSMAGEEVFVSVSLLKDIFWGALDCTLFMEIGNVFYGTTSELTVSMAVPVMGKSQIQLPVEVEKCGKISFCCRKLKIQDILGLFYLTKDIKEECSFVVLPKPEQREEREVEGLSGMVAESEESRNKGSDYAEVSDIREYVPGDRLRDIHWKLSAKQDTLMVKERVSVAGSEMVVLLKLEEKEEAEKIITEGYAFCHSLIKGQMPVKLLCWNQNDFGFDAYPCGNSVELESAFSDLFQTELKNRLSDSVKQYMRNCYPYLGNYLCIAGKNGEAEVELCGND